MISAKMLAAAPVAAGQVVGIIESPVKVAPITSDRLRAAPIFGVAIQSVVTGQKVEIQLGGAYGALGRGPVAIHA